MPASSPPPDPSPDEILAAALDEVRRAELDVSAKAEAEARADARDACGRAEDLDAAMTHLDAARERADAARIVARGGDDSLPRAGSSLSGDFPRVGSAGLALTPGTPGIDAAGAAGAASASAQRSSEIFGLARCLSTEVDAPAPADAAPPAAEAAAAEGELAAFADGALVETVGIKSEKMNERRGRVLGRDAATGRVQVNLGGDIGVRGVKPGNLRLVEDAPAAPAAASAGESSFPSSPAAPADPAAAAAEAAAEADAAALQAWLMHVDEPAGPAKMKRAFDGFVYPLDDALLPRLVGRLGIFLVDGPEVEALRRCGQLERLRRHLRRGFLFAAPPGAEQLVEALACGLAAAAGARLVAVDAAAVSAAQQRAGGGATAGGALRPLLTHLRKDDAGAAPALVWLRDPDLLQSASLCDALQDELRRGGGGLMVLAASREKSRDAAPRRPHASAIPGGADDAFPRAGSSIGDAASLGAGGVPDLPDDMPEHLKEMLHAELRKAIESAVRDGGGGGRVRQPSDYGAALAGAGELPSAVLAQALGWKSGGSRQLNIEWRRFAQLADDAVARGTHPRFPAKPWSPEEERRFVRSDVLPRHRAGGLPDIEEGLRRLWDGERDPAALAAGHDDAAAAVLRMLLREYEAQKHRMDHPGAALTAAEVDRLRRDVDTAMAPGERARLLSSRQHAASREWPPDGVLVPSECAMAFILNNEVKLRRVAQLAVPSRCRYGDDAGNDSFGGDGVPAERGIARAHVLKWQRQGWVVAGAVEQLWRGDRAATVAEGVDPNSAAVIRTLLRTAELEEEAAKAAGGAAQPLPAPAELAEWLVDTSDGWRALSPQDAAMLEAAHAGGTRSLESVSTTFSGHPHTFDLREMTQLNCVTGTRRDLRRVAAGDAGGAPRVAADGAAVPRSPRSTAAQRRETVDLLERVEITPPKDPKKLQLWRSLLRRDVERGRRLANTQLLRHEFDDRGVACPAVADGALPPDVAARLAVRDLRPAEAAAAATEALVHGITAGAPPGADGRPTVSAESLLFALATSCRIDAAKGARRGHTAAELEGIVGKNQYEKGLLDGLMSPDDIGVSWDQVGGLATTKELLREATVYPLKYPELYQTGGVASSPPGVLLFGPPGTGKTHLAKAVATETGASFLRVDSTSIGSKWYGESEKFARAVFTLARKVAPAIVFIDEIDSLASARDDSERGTIATVKTTLLREWDGLAGDNQGVMVIGATNRPHTLDEAVLSRMPRRVLVDLPTADELGEIIAILLRDVPKEEGLDLHGFAAKHLTGYAGRDVKELVRVAALSAGHDVARRLEEGGRPLTSREVEQARAPVTAAGLRAAREKVLPAGGGEQGQMLAKIKEWMATVGLDDGRGSGSKVPSMYL